MNRLLASTSLVVLALMTAPVMAQTGADAPAQHAPAPAQATAPTTPAPASPSSDPAKAPASTAQATTPAAPGATPATPAAPALTQRAPAPAVLPSAPVVAPSATSPSAASPATAPSATQHSSAVDAARLIGRTVRNAAQESIGEITSVVIARDGAVSSVIVGVGRFLGGGQREVAIRWQDLQIRENGATVYTNVTREQLTALPVYQYAPNQRPGVIAFPTTMNAPATATPATPATAAPVAAAAPAAGGMSANDLIGSSVRSPTNDAIGRVYDVLLDRTGAARSLVVSSGGMLGIGERRVEVPYSEFRFVREGTSLNVVSRLTAAQIAQVAEYNPTAR